MRATQTPAEHRLWQILRNKRFAGYKFKRQLPIDQYIADFVCLGQRLIVEADGGQHAESKHDGRRDADLKAQGFRILRFWNTEIFDNEEGVLTRVLDALLSPLPSAASRLPPSPAKGRGEGDFHA
jgi:very-short-patch-repair endonuclease